MIVYTVEEDENKQLEGIWELQTSLLTKYFALAGCKEM